MILTHHFHPLFFDPTAVVKRCQESKTALWREQSLREDAERREISGSQDMDGRYIATMGLLGPEFHHFNLWRWLVVTPYKWLEIHG